MKIVPPAALVAFLACCPPLRAQTSSEISNETCFECHADTSMASETRPVPGLFGQVGGGREPLTLQVTPQSLLGTPHDGFSCQDCHQGIEEIPHPETLAPVDCARCHGSEAIDLSRGVHSKTGPAAPYTPQCVNCHGAHRILPREDAASSISPDHLPATCGVCHRETALMRRLGVQVPNPVLSYLQSIHWQAISARGELKAATCTDCHGAHRILASDNPSSPIFKGNIPKTCGRCHESIASRYEEGIHGRSLAAGNFEAPACADCHGEHEIESPQSPQSSTYAVNVSTTCAQCHGSVLLAQRFGLPSGVVSSYRASYHGLANQYGSTAVANCASCHRAHLILPRSDPQSSINPANLQRTCGSCHPGATEAFAATPIHLEITQAGRPILYWIRYAYIVLLATVLAGLGIHNLADFLRRYAETLKRLRARAGYVRMTRGDLLQHWVLLLSFFLLVLTGFALRYPRSFWSIPFRISASAFAWRGILHRIAAVALIAAAFYHLGSVTATFRGRRFFVDMLPRLHDLRDFRAQMAWFVGRRPVPARFGRFSYLEKLEYLALLWGTAVMSLTGLALWFKTAAVRLLPDWGLSAALIIHFYEAVLAFTTILIWHLYNVFTHTAHPPFNTVWLNGRMTLDEIEEEHPRLAKDLRRKPESPGRDPKDKEP